MFPALAPLEVMFRYNFWKPFGIVMESMAVLGRQLVISGSIGGMEPPWDSAHLHKKLFEARRRDDLKQNGWFVGGIPHGMRNPSRLEEERACRDGYFLLSHASANLSSMHKRKLILSGMRVGDDKPSRGHRCLHQEEPTIRIGT